MHLLGELFVPLLLRFGSTFVLDSLDPALYAQVSGMS